MSGWAYHHGDALGSVRQLTDGGSAITLAKGYQPFGDVLSSDGDASTPYGFTSEWTDVTGMVFLRARYYEPGVGRFITRDVWPVDYTKPLSLNGWLYVFANPVKLIDPTGYWACSGHSDCEMWVKNALNKLNVSGETGQRLVNFFYQYDEFISNQKTVRNYDPCSGSLHPGMMIEFGTPLFGAPANALIGDVLQLKNTPSVIDGQEPSGYGVILFGHEISHYAQGIHRITIQGELLSRFVEQQLRLDLVPIFGYLESKITTELVKFNPFYKESLEAAKDWLVWNLKSQYIWLPTRIGFGVGPSWLDRFAIRDVEIPAPPVSEGPKPGPTPPDPIPPKETPVPPGTPTP
jgi:RHS repeat-associated protein